MLDLVFLERTYQVKNGTDAQAVIESLAHGQSPLACLFTIFESGLGEPVEMTVGNDTIS